jgi:hypothetical protein
MTEQNSLVKGNEVLEELEKLRQLLHAINEHKRAEESANLPARTAVNPPVMHYLTPIQWREKAQNSFGCDRFVPVNAQR